MVLFAPFGWKGCLISRCPIIFWWGVYLDLYFLSLSFLLSNHHNESGTFLAFVAWLGEFEFGLEDRHHLWNTTAEFPSLFFGAGPVIASDITRRSSFLRRLRDCLPALPAFFPPAPRSPPATNNTATGSFPRLPGFTSGAVPGAHSTPSFRLRDLPPAFYTAPDLPLRSASISVPFHNPTRSKTRRPIRSEPKQTHRSRRQPHLTSPNATTQPTTTSNNN